MDRRESSQWVELTAAEAAAIDVDVNKPPVWGRDLNSHSPPERSGATAAGLRGIGIPEPYDPVAVLEAMRGLGMAFRLYFDADGKLYAGVSYKNGLYQTFLASDFLSAVKWLHGRAVSFSPEFAKQWPVPEA